MSVRLGAVGVGSAPAGIRKGHLAGPEEAGAVTAASSPSGEARKQRGLGGPVSGWARA